MTTENTETTEAATPETDASRGYALTSHYGRSEGSYLQMDKAGPFVHAEVARKLERERDEAREAIIGWENKWKCAVDMAARAELERDEAIADRDIARLAALESDKAHDRMVGELEKVYKERDEAREALREIEAADWKTSGELRGMARKALEAAK